MYLKICLQMEDTFDRPSAPRAGMGDDIIGIEVAEATGAAAAIFRVRANSPRPTSSW
jgi:hypothetical protein